MRRLRLTLLVLLLLLIGGSALLYWLNPPARINISLRGEDAGGQSAEVAEPQARDITYNHVENGVHKWGLVADGGDFDPVSGFIMLRNVKLTFYQEGGGTLYLESDTGQYDQQKHIVIVTGNVFGRNSKNITINTSKLIYYDAGKLVETDEKVTVAGENFAITSQGMKVFLEPEQIVFENNVNSRFWSGDGESAASPRTSLAGRRQPETFRHN